MTSDIFTLKTVHAYTEYNIYCPVPLSVISFAKKRGGGKYSVEFFFLCRLWLPVLAVLSYISGVKSQNIKSNGVQKLKKRKKILPE